MALSFASASLSFAGAGLSPARSARAQPAKMETEADLVALQGKPGMLGYWNPTPLAGMEFWGQSQEATIGWLRHAEIKHGRVAMAAFVGFCVQSNGIVFPWNIQGPLGFGPFTDGVPAVAFADIAAAGSPLEQWDALSTIAKLQIICAVGFLEWWGENSYAFSQSGQKHYMRGGKPGFYPKLKGEGNLPHPVPLNLWDPLNLTGKMSEEAKERKLVCEINNGRAAMLGIMGFVASAKGCIVPGLDSVGIPSYAGEVMAPFTPSDNLALVPEMYAVFNELKVANF